MQGPTCFFFPQLMSRISTVRYEKQSLIAHCLLGYFFCTFAKILHHPSYSEPRLKRRYVFFLVFYCEHLIALCHFLLNQSFDGMGSTNTHDTRLSAEGARFGVLHPNNGLLCSVGYDLENSLGPTPPKMFIVIISI